MSDQPGHRPHGLTQVAAEAGGGLKGNPSCLAAIMLAAVFAVLTFVAMQRDAERRSRTVDLMMERCFGYEPGLRGLLVPIAILIEIGQERVRSLEGCQPFKDCLARECCPLVGS